MVTGPTYSLRPATEDDYDFLYRLHVASIRPAVEATWGWDDAFQQEYFQSHWHPANRQIVIANEVEVGTITLEEYSDSLFLDLIEIHPDYQGRGIGAAIIRDVVAEAHQRGLPVELNVLKANPRAKQLYERLGFVVTEEREERYVMASFPQTGE